MVQEEALFKELGIREFRVEFGDATRCEDGDMVRSGENAGSDDIDTKGGEQCSDDEFKAHEVAVILGGFVCPPSDSAISGSCRTDTSSLFDMVGSTSMEAKSLFPVSFCTMARKFSGSVVIRCGAKTCTMRTIGWGLLDFVLEVLELWIATEFVVFRGLLTELGGAMVRFDRIIRLRYVLYYVK